MYFFFQGNLRVRINDWIKNALQILKFSVDLLNSINILMYVIESEVKNLHCKIKHCHEFLIVIRFV